ncbi:TlpA disulfide reductase family protein [Actinosynnema sp. NPDC020468]|uniref:TlpA family protein disulfide reductase n=1 Tax=Actinosynnema sp. NPDC020468 TaxID=3154488 RepID=UPI00340B4380
MSRGARWALVALVLVVAGVVALWPRGGSEPPAERPHTQAGAPADLLMARNQAALRPCPQGAEGPSALRGLKATCLGDGQQLDVASALGGKALVNFWATWCVPCQGELRVLDEYAQQPGAVPVLAVQVESKEADGLELLAKLGVHLPAVIDEADGVRKAVKAPRTLPASFLVGADGSVAQVLKPLVFESVEQVRGVVG